MLSQTKSCTIIKQFAFNFLDLFVIFNIKGKLWIIFFATRHVWYTLWCFEVNWTIFMFISIKKDTTCNINKLKRIQIYIFSPLLWYFAPRASTKRFHAMNKVVNMRITSFNIFRAIVTWWQSDLKTFHHY